MAAVVGGQLDRPIQVAHVMALERDERSGNARRSSGSPTRASGSATSTDADQVAAKAVQVRCQTGPVGQVNKRIRPHQVACRSRPVRAARAANRRCAAGAAARRTRKVRPRSRRPSIRAPGAPVQPLRSLSQTSPARPRMLPSVPSRALLYRAGHAVAMGAAPRGQPLRRAALRRALRARPPRGRGRALGLARARARGARDGRSGCARIPDAMFAEPGCASVLAVGQSLPFRRGGSVSLPLDVSRTLEELLDRAELDFVHVHEPFAPSASSAALRHSRALNVGTLPLDHRALRLHPGGPQGRRAAVRPPRRPHRQLRRHARPGRALLPRRLPRDPAGRRPAAPPRRRATGRRRSCSPPRRSAAPCGCSCARCGGCRPTSTGAPRSGCATRSSAPAVSLSRRLRERVQPRRARPTARRRSTWRARRSPWPPRPAPRPAPQLVLRALAGGAVPVVARLPQYEEALREGELGLLFEPRDALTLAAQLERLIAEPALVARLRGPDRRARTRTSSGRAWPTSSRRCSRRSPRAATANGRPDVQQRLAQRDFIHVDLHMHTDHSPDCATPVDTLLDTATRVGLGAIAITDHNEISGALEARELRQRHQGDRGRGGQDGRPGRGDRPLHRGEDPARA